ncbi:hypothetical protein Poly51_13640 [Rubripirellula tenax]|uniref:Gamma-glutamylcyclotransferase n=2 Tax=Rubripirellula tenax TaxID=2528015 RepID=A0A5C6FAZ9_9BACT|nr:hypothetical protein Poly51_13640 [Rubripirellula tenax]
MHPRRMRARVTGVVPVDIGFVSGRRLAFHKRGIDGSGKADATVTGNPNDRVWGVIYSLPEHQKEILDGYESVGVGYDCENAMVQTQRNSIRASIYTARFEAIQADLSPYSWYLAFVLLGAIANRLPAEYLQSLRRINASIDQDRERHVQNMLLAET